MRTRKHISVPAGAPLVSPVPVRIPVSSPVTGVTWWRIPLTMICLISSCTSSSALVAIAIVVAIITGSIRRVKVERRVFIIIVIAIVIYLLNFEISESLHSAAKPDTCNASWTQRTQITIYFLNLDFVDVQKRAFVASVWYIWSFSGVEACPF
jgi:hypothetical protein